MNHLLVRNLPRSTKPFASRALVGLIAAAVPILTVLLLAFQHVVRSSIERGMERRAMSVQQVSEAKSCNALADVHMQEQCLLALIAMPSSAMSSPTSLADLLVANPIEKDLVAADDQPLNARIK